MARTLTPWTAELAEVLPGDAVRAAAPEDAVDGVAPALAVEPSTLEEAGAVLRFAAARGLAVSPVGGGTKLGWGNPPERLDLVLSTKRLCRVIDHAAGDLVVRAEAGVALAALQERVAGSGQRLALDPFDPVDDETAAATLGGIVATAAAGPRRLRYGTPRDLLIGVTYVLADGTVARAGGKVVKNVAGYDLMKLLTGSFGTLALIADVTFRLHPLPARASWVGATIGSPEEAGSAVRAILDDHGLDPIAVELSWHAGRGRLEVLFEGTERGVAAQTARAVPGLQGVGLTAHRADAPTRMLGAADRGRGAVRVKLTHPPASLPGALHAIEDVGRRHDLEPTVSAHAATGVCTLDLPSDGEPDVLRTAVEDLRGWAFAAGGAAVIMDAPAGVKEGLDAWGPVGDALPLMRRVKDRFDPGRVLNPGRFVGGI
jgi:glycolate oxidase FAD binding subunit